MNYVGIIAEYNPFHSGHRYQIAQTRQQLGENTTIIVIMSGNWVQQAHCAISDKWTRAKLALEGGADLVLELPTPWATASAEKFARGAVYLLESTGLVTHLSFGSEEGDLSSLMRVQETLQHPDYPSTLQQELKTGVSFPMARERALHKLLGAGGSLLQSPNNILALEYLCALEYFKSNIVPLTILRQGGGFHSVVELGENLPLFTSATDLREKLQKQQWDYVEQYLSPFALSLLKTQDFPSLYHCQRGILAQLYRMSAEDWGKLPDSGVGEGLPHRLEKIAKNSSSIQEFLENAKTKRYTHARLRRLLLHSFLQLKEENTPDLPCYLRILAMNQKGSAALKQMKATATLPLLNKTAQIDKLPLTCQKLFQQEVCYTDLYQLCFPKILPTGAEWRNSAHVMLP